MSAPDPTPTPFPQQMARQPVVVGHNPVNFVRGARPSTDDTITALSNPSAFQLLQALPTPKACRGVVSPSMSREALFRFFCMGAASAAGATFTSRIWGLSGLPHTDAANKRAAVDYIGDPLVDLTIVLGETAYTSREWGDFRVGRQISIDANHMVSDSSANSRRSAWLLGCDSGGGVAANDLWMTLAIDRAAGYMAFIVELLSGGATSPSPCFLYSA